MAVKLTTYDPAEDLASDAAIASFMAEAFATEDPGYIAHALGIVARAKGMAQIAEQAGLSREQLYRSLSERGNPTLKTTIAVMKALGIELTAKDSRLKGRAEGRSRNSGTTRNWHAARGFHQARFSLSIHRRGGRSRASTVRRWLNVDGR